MNTTKRVTPDAVAEAVMADYMQRRGTGHVNADYLNRHYLPDASRAALLEAIREASRQCLIVDRSHHGARPDWIPSRQTMLDVIERQRTERAELLEALRNVMAVCESSGYDMYARGEFAQARAAVAKATGDAA